MECYDEKYPDEVLRGIDGSLATAVSALRCARDRIYSQLEKDAPYNNVNTTDPTKSVMSYADWDKYEYGAHMAINYIDSLIAELIDACVKS